MKNNKKITLTAILLMIVLTANTNICKAEYEYWFWDTLAEPIGVITDIAGAGCHGAGNGLHGFWDFLFGKSKREPKQTDLWEDMPPE